MIEDKIMKYPEIMMKCHYQSNEYRIMSNNIWRSHEITVKN